MLAIYLDNLDIFFLNYTVRLCCLYDIKNIFLEHVSHI